MRMTDTRRIAASPDVVWAALLDPEMLMVAVPGCEELSGSVEAGFEAVVVQKVGPVKARFRGTVRISNIEAPDSLTLSGEGTGGAAGFAHGEARVRLRPVDGSTELFYEVEAKVGGKLAQIGSRIIDGFARKMAGEFFARFQQAVEGPAATAEKPEAEIGSAKGGWLKRAIGRS